MTSDKIKTFIIDLQKKVLSNEALLTEFKNTSEKEKKTHFLSIIDTLDALNSLLEKHDRYFDEETVQKKGPTKFLRSLARIELMLLETLNLRDVKPIELKQFDIVDPTYCQIIDTQIATNNEDVGKIYSVVKNGYMYRDQILRLSQVISYVQNNHCEAFEKNAQ